MKSDERVIYGMFRTITTEERKLLLENPELVMFDPYRGFRTHRASLIKALILPVVTGALILLWWFLYPEFTKTHPELFAGIGCVALIFVVGSVPMLYLVSENHALKKARRVHYAKQLALLLPIDLECIIARVQWVTEQKAEGEWIIDGKEEMFGFSSYVNCFRIDPNTDLAVIRGRNDFLAFIKQDTKTESFYRASEFNS